MEPRYNARMSNESKPRSNSDTAELRADHLLLTLEEVQEAMGPAAHLEQSSVRTSGGMGEMIRSAAADSSFRRFNGHVHHGNHAAPVAISAMALLFDSCDTASRTYAQVAEAAHLRTQISGTDVAVETVSSQRDVVSYWGFLYRHRVILVLTLDTLDVQQVSIGDLRSLVLTAADKMENAIR